MHEQALEYLSTFQEYLIEVGISEAAAAILTLGINAILILTLLFLLDKVLHRITVEVFKAFTNKTKSTFDDYLVLTNFPRYVAHIIPLIILKAAIVALLIDYPVYTSWFIKLFNVYVIILIVKILRSLLRTAKNYLGTKEEYHDKPLQSYVQVLVLFFWGIAIFLIIIELFDQKAWQFALQLGAASAVILLIFKDTILGVVASIQVSINDIVRIGDWITFSKYGADGNVTEINLATVKVQNFDNTYTTIPTYSLIADSFQNWRGMQESKGRRIKRAIYIKQSSIRFVTTDDLERYKKIELIKPYVDHREQDVNRFNKLRNIDKSLAINGRNQTNLGIFRKYIDAYLYENPAINKDLFLMVRHLAPTSQGIPLEIFCFSKDKRWENYEHIQADIFDHILASVHFFDLELFEEPSSSDIAKFLSNRTESK